MQKQYQGPNICVADFIGSSTANFLQTHVFMGVGLSLWSLSSYLVQRATAAYWNSKGGATSSVSWQEKNTSFISEKRQKDWAIQIDRHGPSASYTVELKITASRWTSSGEKRQHNLLPLAW